MVSLSLTITAVLAILVGLIVLIWPKIINYAIGLYLIAFGILRLIDF
jgi:uncharacterized membrane protein HdeD (DUF308 family)